MLLIVRRVHYHKCCTIIPRKNKIPKVTWEQEATSPPPVVDPIIAAIHDCSTIFARWRNCACQYNTQFLATYTHHPKWQLDCFSGFSIAGAELLLYVTLRCHIFHQNLPLRRGMHTPSNTYYLMGVVATRERWECVHLPSAA